MTVRALLAFTILVLAVALCSAQVSSQGAVSASGSFSGTASFGGLPPFSPPAVTGAAYSGEEINENVKILTDGTRIIQTMPGRKVWRDSEGRTRIERSLGMGPNQASMPVIVEITDPVGGYKYTLDTQKKVAHRQTLPPPFTRGMAVTGGSGAVGLGVAGAQLSSPPPAAMAAVPGAGGGGGGSSASLPAPAAAPIRPKFSNESIGTQSIDGVVAEGTRHTITYPVGMMGNDREFSVVSETWVSPELKIQLLSKTNDPRNGESTFRIQNLSRTPPDPGLFIVPADYTVADETGPFSIRYEGR